MKVIKARHNLYALLPKTLAKRYLDTAAGFRDALDVVLANAAQLTYLMLGKDQKDVKSPSILGSKRKLVNLRLLFSEYGTRAVE